MAKFLKTQQAADILGLSYWTLVSWRSKKIGPKWRRFGKKKIFYDIDDLEAFIESSAFAEGTLS